MLDPTPMFVAGDNVGFLLVHGFTGGPWDLRPLAEVLVAAGYTVSLPLLPGHGNDNVALGKYGRRQWQAAVREAREQIRRHCSNTILVGFSMGGALAISEMVREPADLLVLLAPALGLTGDRRRRLLLSLLPVVKYMRPWFYPLANVSFADPAVRRRIARFAPPDLDLDDPAVQSEIRQRVRVAMAAVDQFYRLARRAHRLAPRITQPVLIMHGRHDRTIPLAFSTALYERSKSGDKTLRIWEHSDHLLVGGPEEADVITEIMQWVQQRLQK